MLSITDLIADPTVDPMHGLVVDGFDRAEQQAAAECLARGELVAFATETVYGLGARADDDAAVARLFAAKGRPSGHPLIVHVADVEATAAWAAEWPATARRLTQALWPGPLTVVVPRRAERGSAAAGGQATIGLRCPSHPVAHGLLVAAARLGVPGVAAPSANRFGRVSPTRAQHVLDEFGTPAPAAGPASGGPVLRILDGGPSPAGIESTLVDCSRGRAVLLRPGVIGRERLEQVLGERVADADAEAPRASGTLASHYAPRAPVTVWPTAALHEALARLPPRPAQALAVYSRTLSDQLAPIEGATTRQTMPDDPLAAAHELFHVLRSFDAQGVGQIWVEAVPDDAAWDGVRDRLERASAPR